VRSAFLLADIKKYAKLAREAWARWKNGDNLAREALAMALFQVANSIIALGEEKHRERGLGIPPTYYAIFEDLKNVGLLDEDELEIIDALIRLRNRIAHKYGRVSDDDLKLLYSILPAAEKIGKKLAE